MQPLMWQIACLRYEPDMDFYLIRIALVFFLRFRLKQFVNRLSRCSHTYLRSVRYSLGRLLARHTLLMSSRNAIPSTATSRILPILLPSRALLAKRLVIRESWIKLLL